MKRVIIGMAMAALALFSGCKTVPTVEQIETVATAVGYAAGLVANETGIKDEARTVVISVLGEVRNCIPADGQTFEEAWTPVIKEKVAQFVEAGKIDAVTGEIVVTAAVLAAKGVDYVFDVRYPKAKQYAELVAAGARGAVDGFLTAFTPPDVKALKSSAGKFDKEAYEYLKKSL